MHRQAMFACCALLLFGSASSTAPSSPPTGVQLEMKNVRLHVDEGIVLDVARLRGVMVARTEGAAPVFDDQQSYVLHLQTAEMSMDMISLQNLMNRHVFAYKGAPLKDIVVEADGARLKMKGKLDKGIDIPFSTTASVAPADGKMRLHVEAMKAI